MMRISFIAVISYVLISGYTTFALIEIESYPTISPSFITTACNPGTRTYCHNRGTCSAAGDVCECDDVLHYWPSEQCSTKHPGPELEEGQCCKPDMVDAYCSYMGTCDSTGQYCNCVSSNYWSAERCDIWHADADPDPQPDNCPPDPVFPPSASPTEYSTFVPTIVSTPSPTVSPSFITTACIPGTRAYCHDRGTCSAAGDVCECDDVLHYWPSEQCSTEHLGPELEEGQCCKPDMVDAYCSHMGTCDSTGQYCNCSSSHFWSAERCDIWHADADPDPQPDTCPPFPVFSPTALPSSSPTTELRPSPPPSHAPTELLTTCNPGTRAYCHNRGTCSAAGDVCECDDVLHYWPSEQCSTKHPGPELEEGQCCKPGMVDAYCSYMGPCNDNGLWCNCPTANFWAREGCATWHPDPDPDPEPELCPGETHMPSSAPSEPSALPSQAPTSPSAVPSSSPSGYPSGIPSSEPTTPTAEPSSTPSGCPSNAPTGVPTTVPSGVPSGVPSCVPTGVPSAVPTGVPSSTPSGVPTGIPTVAPSSVPSGMPSCVPSGMPSGLPSVVPTGEPSAVPSIVPSSAPSTVPSASPTPAPTYCFAGDRSFCNNNGVCGADSEGCECDDPTHYWPSEHCSTFRDGPEIQDGHYCTPNERDFYCSWLGDCSADGLSCICDDPDHRSSTDRCKTWSPPPPPSSGLCIAGDRAPCHNQGTCESSSGSNACTCDDPNHYWASEMCEFEHFGGQLAPGDCCIPGESDYYCSWMGKCDTSGDFCLCFDTDHRWASERCSVWNEASDPVPVGVDGECPMLMFDTSSSTRSADHSVMGLSSNVFYVVVFVAVGVAILAVVAMRRRTAVKEELRHSSSFSFDDAVGSEKSKSIFSTKSPYIAEVAADTIEKGMEKAGSFIRGSSFGYSDVSGEKDSFFGMESPIVTAQKEEEIEMMKPSNFSYEDMTGKDSMFEMQSPLETAKEEELLELEKPSNFSYDDMVRQPSLVDTMENSLHLASKEEAQALVVKDEGNFGVQNEEMNI